MIGCREPDMVVNEISTNMDPEDAVNLACDLLEYARMHTGRFSKRQLTALEHAETFARRTVGELD